MFRLITHTIWKRTTFNKINYAIEHYHYDIFEAKNELFDRQMKILFMMDIKGNIHTLSVQFELAVEPIIFELMPDKNMRDRDFLEKLTGDYIMNSIPLKITMKGENTLIVTVVGQPPYELVPYQGMEFKFKGIPGISIEFILDDSGKVIEAKITQPEGIFTAKKK